MKKKVLFFIGSISNPRGAERVTAIIANGLVNNGYEVEILSIFNGEKSFYELDKQIKLSQLFQEKVDIKKNYLEILLKLRNFLKMNNINIIIDVDIILTLFTFIATIGLKIKLISWEHFNYLSNAGSSNRSLARRIALKFSDKIITLTEEDREEFCKRTKNKQKIINISNPSTFINEEPNLLNENIILTVGRLNYQKGYDLLIEKWMKIKEKYPNWKLEIAGEGEQRIELESRIKELKLENHVTLLGNVENIEEKYKKSSIYVLCSRFEGLPMTLIEAKSFGLPIVALDCKTGPKEIIKDGIDGILVEDRNIELLVDKIIELIENLDKRKKMGYNAFLDERYNRNSIVQNWVKMLEKL